MMGETVLLICSAYFYHGKVEALSDVEVELSNPGIVYQTGDWADEGFEDKQNLPGNVFIKLHAVESYVQI